MANFTMLDHVLKVAPLVNQLTQADVGIAVSDLEKWLCYYPARTLDLKVQVGARVPEGTVTYEAMRTKKRVVQEIDSKNTKYGLPYIGVGLPILDENGEVIGGIGVTENTERKEFLLNTAKELEKSLQGIQSSMQEIAAEAEELSATSQELKAISDETAARVGETATILSFVKNIANRINILGLNASIEAARVGDAGRGFNVVANEVRTLARATNESTGQISTIIEKIKEGINSTNSAAGMVKNVTQEQAEKLAAINPILENLAILVEKLTKASEDLSRGTK
ncbi:MAG: methyl-accepting chemotaxis protein [Peptococcaceae bacterium]|nr:methyl-accepting chemotaxis protein [Peptococcaceae bacterium]MDH7525739.1 methyl-accepting chemotaxis protein [Peptococcaceae bacterium]